MRIAPAGRARISARHPTAIGECDRCSFWVSLNDLRPQFQWAGNNLVDTGLLVCDRCLDIPQPQFRTPLLPADPYPRIPARPSPNVTPIPNVGSPLFTTPTNQGFSVYFLQGSAVGAALENPGLVIAAAVQQSGVAQPPALAFYPVPLQQMQPAQVIPAYATRTYILFYNPASFPVQIALSSTITLGAITNMSIGAGEAYFWSDAQNLGQAYRGEITALSSFGGGLPLWVWVDAPNTFSEWDGGLSIWDNGGSIWDQSGIAGTAWDGGTTVWDLGTTSWDE